MKILIGMIALLVLLFVITQLQKKKRSNPKSTPANGKPQTPHNPYTQPTAKVQSSNIRKPLPNNSARRNTVKENDDFLDSMNPINPLSPFNPLNQSHMDEDSSRRSFADHSLGKSTYDDHSNSRSYHSDDTSRSYGGSYSGGYDSGSSSSSSSSDSSSGGGGWD